MRVCMCVRACVCVCVRESVCVCVCESVCVQVFNAGVCLINLSLHRSVSPNQAQPIRVREGEEWDGGR